MTAVTDPFERSWGDRTYTHATLVNHAGRVIAVAQGADGEVVYSVLDPDDTSGDADGWSDQPQRLTFPSEVALVGFGAVDAIALPQIRRGGQRVPSGRVLTDSELDRRLSSTARLTDPTGPVQVISDGRLLYVFRQALSGDDVLDVDGQSLPVAAGTLLLDRFMLVGSELQNLVEVRYQRSRSKTTPADGRDTLGAKDLDGRPFVEPTQVVGFITGLVGCDVAPVLLPTAVAGKDRWLFCRRDAARQRLDLIGCARTTDGLFDTQGQAGWRCPVHSDSFALEPSACAMPSMADPARACGQPRLPVQPEEIWAGSALRLGGGESQQLDLPVAAEAATSEVTVELWLSAPVSTTGVMRHLLGDPARPGALVLLAPDGHLEVTVMGQRLLTDPGTVVPGRWLHLALAYGPGGVRVYVDGALSGRTETTAALPACPPPTRVGRGGDPALLVDDVRVWTRARSAREIREQRGMRLTGFEPGLSHYWRLDEGRGRTARDLAGTADAALPDPGPDDVWVPSGARVAVPPGLTRASVALDGVTLASGPAAICYYQQSRMVGGYAGTSQPSKTAPRVMIALDAGSGRSAILDLGLHPDGSLAEVPALVRLAEPSTESRADAAPQPFSADQTARDLAVAQAVLVDPEASTQGATTETAAVCTAYRDAVRAVAATERKWSEAWRSFKDGTTTFYENSAAHDAELNRYGVARHAVTYTGAASEASATTKSSDGIANWNDLVTSVAPAPYSRVTLWRDAGFQGDSYVVPPGGEQELPREWNDVASSWKVEPDPEAQTRETADRARALAARGDTHARLAQRLDQLLPTADGDAPQRLLLPLVSIDAQGATVTGAVTGLIPANGRPVLVESALGRVLLYSRDGSGRLRSAHFDAQAASVSGALLVAGPVAGVKGGAGSPAVQVMVSPRRPELLADPTCRLEVGSEAAGDKLALRATLYRAGLTVETELLSDLPREATAWAEKVRATSRLVTVVADSRAGSTGSSTGGTAASSVVFSVPDRSSIAGFGITPRGRAVSLSGQGSQLTGSAAAMTRTGDLTVEAWVRAEPVADDQCRILVRQSQGGVGYGLALRSRDDPSAPGGRATLLQGIVGTELVRETVSAFPPGGWRHVAMTYEQRYGVQLDGDTGALRLGDSPALAMTGDLSLEVDLSLAADRKDQVLVARGNPADPAKGAPYLFWIDADRHPAFAYRDGDGAMQVVRSTLTVPVGTHSRVAVSRKAGTTTPTPVTAGSAEAQAVTVEARVTIAFRVNGVSDVRPDLRNGAGVRSSDEPTWVGRPWRPAPPADGVPDVRALQATVTRVRLWSQARPVGYLGEASRKDSAGLVADWTFREGRGQQSSDDCGQMVAKLEGATTWVPSPDPKASPMALYVDGEVAATVDPGVRPWKLGDQFTVGAQQTDGTVPQLRLAGWLEELRVWRTTRTEEQLQDNMFRVLDSEMDDLLGYWRFDVDDATGIVGDSGPGAVHLTRTPRGGADVRILASTAPIGQEGPQILEVGRSLPTRWTASGTEAAAAAEYGDLQSDVHGRLVGVYKRCYAYVAAGRLHLVTGYKVGDTTVEWVGQVQTDPQLVGYIEGAPPVPGENFVDGTRYGGASSVELSLADTVTYSSASSTGVGFTTAIETKLQGGYKNEVEAGLAVSTKVSDVEVAAGLAGSTSIRDGHLEESQSGRGAERTQASSLELSGGMGSSGRFEPANAGFALVRSSTADRFALRLQPSGALVAYSTRLCADIPPDWNVISFRIDPRYTKQGVLDGRQGLLADTDYPHAGSRSSDLSYFKPVEAYELKRRISQQDQLLLARYEQANARKDERVHLDDVRRSMVNTYVWTADGGTFAEETQSLDSVRTSDAGTFSFEGAAGLAVDASVYWGVGAGFKTELSALFGGYRETTTTKARDSSTTFGIEVDLSKVERDLGTVGKQAGKVDAYRFMTFYLDPDADHFDVFYERVVDAQWLQRSHPSAVALREARQSGKRPQCWRVLHRVTYVSRILPEPGPHPTSLEEVLADCDLASNYELVRLLEPSVRHRTGSYAVFRTAVEDALRAQRPRLLPHREEIIRWLAHFYGVGLADGASPYAEADPEPLSVLLRVPGSAVAGRPVPISGTVLSELSPAPAQTLQWSAPQATTGVVFSAPGAPTGTVTFATAGSYLVRLSAVPDGSGVAPGFAEQRVTVTAGQPEAAPVTLTP